MGSVGGFAETLVASSGYQSFGRYPRMDIDLLGTPRVGFRGGPTAGIGEIAVASYEGGLWVTETLADSFGVYGYDGKDFDLATDGVSPAVAYAAGSQTVISKVSGFIIDDWSVTGGTGLTYSNTPALAFDADGIAHVVLVENSDTVRYAAGGESSWAVQDIADISAVGSHRLDIDIQNGEVAVCYLDNAFPVSTGVFVAQSTDGFSAIPLDADANQACSITYDDSGELHVVYRTAGGALRHGWSLAGSWSTRTIASAPAPGIGYRWPEVSWVDGTLHIVAWNQYSQSVVYILDPLDNLNE